MGHYDECRPGYCASCGAGPGNLEANGGVCPFCHPPKAKKVKPVEQKPTVKGLGLNLSALRPAYKNHTSVEWTRIVADTLEKGGHPLKAEQQQMMAGALAVLMLQAGL